MKLGFMQVWTHKSNPNIYLIILENINEKYKTKICGPIKNMYLIEIVSSQYITSHYKYAHTLKRETEPKKKLGRKKS